MNLSNKSSAKQKFSNSKDKPSDRESKLINDDGVTRSNYFKPHNYMYKMIETMLPKAMVRPDSQHIRLLEM